MSLDIPDFGPPSPGLMGGSFQAARAEVSPTTIDILATTRPWVRLIGWAFLVFSGLGALTALLSLGAADAMSKALPIKSLIPLMIAIYAAQALIGWKLVRFGAAIGVLERSHAVADLDHALSEQRSFWKIAGVGLVLLFFTSILAVGTSSALFMSR